MAHALCSPTSFSQAPAPPRMRLLPIKKKAPTAPSDLTQAPSIALPSRHAAAASQPDTAVQLVRPPALQQLDAMLPVVAGMYYQAPEVGVSTASFALIRRSTLGLLTSPARETSVLDSWNPREIALFESTICLVGKMFSHIAKVIGTKSCQEVIAFYYVWKMTPNYAMWKARFKHLYGETD